MNVWSLTEGVIKTEPVEREGFLWIQFTVLTYKYDFMVELNRNTLLNVDKSVMLPPGTEKNLITCDGLFGHWRNIDL